MGTVYLGKRRGGKKMMIGKVFLNPSCSSGIFLKSRHLGLTQDRYEHNLSNYSMTFRFSKLTMYFCCARKCKKT
jgi:hypothetical protein